MPIVFETEVEGLLSREANVNMLAERDPGGGFAEATVGGERGDGVEDASSPYE